MQQAHHSLSPPQPALPPGPRQRWLGLPELGAMRRDYLGFMSALRRRHGDIVHMRLVGYRDYSFFHPEQVRELLLAAHERLIRWERGTEVFASAHGRSVLVAEGAAWQRQRRLLQPAFAPRQVEAFAPRMAEAAEAALARWPARDAQFPFEAAMTQLTMEVILRSLFSRADEAPSRAAAQAVHRLGQIGMSEMYWPVSAPLWAPWKAGKRRALATLDALIHGELARRRREPPPADAPADLLQMLLALRDGEADERPALSERALRDECMTIFLAGHETSASALTWWGWCMTAHPQAQARAAAEVLAQLGPTRAPTMADLPRLPWLTACIKETLRLYPPAPALLTRRSIAPLTIGGHELPPGATIRLTPGVIQRDPRWFEEPEAFRPERFDPASGHAEIPRGAWLPFGAGPRVCLGSHFALTEITLIAALILQRHELHPQPGAPAPRPVLNITLRPEQALRLALRRRD
ncbi:cytochrome P450 [Roseateles sp. DAIF2]|uniref:cytochrome P450 n=1 Tax=Roseateles sp. DAIF2 TaxID=2714952 RepID=UPI0018A31BED|nr:cytochrome P450 [Roseateles sp. DAIF2]QPF71980.1 cytochrome P450 [Roseateles sp. DAIF2]